MAANSICSIPGCGKPVRSIGLCQSHYLRNYRHGDPLAGGTYHDPQPPGTPCLAEGCQKPRSKGRYCSMHSERLRRHGDLNKGAFRPRGKCKLEGCDRPHYGKGLCLAHFKRLKRHGDPRGGGIPWGAAQKFIRNAITYSGDDCLLFPYCRAQGYGRINIDGERVSAHVYVAEKVHGPKPSPKHEVCHSCGKGHEGCVNPRHLRWGTRSDNVQDAIRHGTFKRPNRWGS